MAGAPAGGSASADHRRGPEPDRDRDGTLRRCRRRDEGEVRADVVPQDATAAREEPDDPAHRIDGPGDEVGDADVGDEAEPHAALGEDGGHRVTDDGALADLLDGEDGELRRSEGPEGDRSGEPELAAGPDRPGEGGDDAERMTSVATVDR